MEEIKVGEYIRTELGQIGKIDEDLKEFIDEHRSISEKDRIEFLGKIKHSPNIIDLIEVGDYVNGNYVKECKNNYVMVGNGLDGFQLWERNIQSITTKEQFKSVEYRLED